MQTLTEQRHVGIRLIGLFLGTLLSAESNAQAPQQLPDDIRAATELLQVVEGDVLDGTEVSFWAAAEGFNFRVSRSGIGTRKETVLDGFIAATSGKVVGYRTEGALPRHAKHAAIRRQLRLGTRPSVDDVGRLLRGTDARWPPWASTAELTAFLPLTRLARVSPGLKVKRLVFQVDAPDADRGPDFGWVVDVESDISSARMRLRVEPFEGRIISIERLP